MSERTNEEIQKLLIKWVKENKYSHGDSYSAWLSKKGNWCVRYYNDYPLQHGAGETFVLTNDEVIQALEK